MRTGLTDGQRTVVESPRIKEGMQVIVAVNTPPPRRTPRPIRSAVPADSAARRAASSVAAQFRRRQPTVLSVNAAVSTRPTSSRVEGVTKVYHMGSQTVHALRGVDLSVKRGEMIAVMGHSGSGKSTLMNMLGCLDVPTSGDYYLDGVKVNGLRKNQLADLRNQKLGFVFQGFNLLARTSALENVELPLLYDRIAASSTTRARWRSVRWSEWASASASDHHPSELSGGQQQRVAIARALVTDADRAARRRADRQPGHAHVDRRSWRCSRS